jgi:hypothetical protein
MAKLIYVSNVSLDGYIEDEHGSFDWTAPDDELFAFITDLVRPVGSYLYGRRLYDTMAPWETDPALAAQSELTSDFANVWQAACRPRRPGSSAPSTPLGSRPRWEHAALATTRVSSRVGRGRRSEPLTRRPLGGDREVIYGARSRQCRGRGCQTIFTHNSRSHGAVKRPWQECCASSPTPEATFRS